MERRSRRTSSLSGKADSTLRRTGAMRASGMSIGITGCSVPLFAAGTGKLRRKARWTAAYRDLAYPSLIRLLTVTCTEPRRSHATGESRNCDGTDELLVWHRVTGTRARVVATVG